MVELELAREFFKLKFRVFECGELLVGEAELIMEIGVGCL